MKVVSVGDVSEQVRGVSYSKGESSEVPRPGFVAILRANNITDEGLIFDDLVYAPIARVSGKQHIHANDVVIAASSGSLSVVGKAAQARKGVDGAFGAFCKVLRPNSKVDPLYFGHFFRTPAYRRIVSGLAAGANINNLKNEHLDNLQIPLPPLPVQKRIAAILDAADALRAKRRESIEQLDSLIQSTFLEMFGDPVTNPKGWDVVPLGKACTKITDGTHHSPPTLSEGVPYVTAKHIKQNQICFFDDPWFVEAKHHEEIYSRCDPRLGDVLYIKDGATTGIAAVNRYDFPFSMLSSVALLRTDGTHLHAEFLTAWLNSPTTKKTLLGYMGGAAIRRLTLAKIKSFDVPLPPLELQTRFASIVESIEQQKTRLKAHLAELDTLFASLQSRAFNGELVA